MLPCTTNVNPKYTKDIVSEKFMSGSQREIYRNYDYDSTDSSEFAHVTSVCSQNENDVDRMRTSFLERLHSASPTMQRTTDRQFSASPYSAFSSVLPASNTGTNSNTNTNSKTDLNLFY